MHGLLSIHELNDEKIPLELVHSDLAEANILSLSKGKFVLTFTDDATNYGIINILPNKNSMTVLNAFKEFQAWAERQSGHKIKELRTDRGKEYMGEMIKYIKSKGIEYNPTAGHSPQSNGVAERMNRTLFEKACTMLDFSGAPLELWGEAVLAATHIRNRIPTSTLNGKTPHEAWYGKKPTIGHIRKWGCKVYRHINKKTGRKKLHKKSMIGYLVGYQGGNIYRIYHPASKELKVSRDVIFSEKEFFEMRRVVKSDLEGIKEDKDMEDGETPSACDDTASLGGISSETETPAPVIHDEIAVQRSEERRVGKECRSRWSPYH